ncbi:hypothetical protein LSCM1_02827 [Leishmania martiniquensis]|uniref:Uncharacterized protein n=1 Tax=Leishmania martiniquensis TaxID=1580590 RepID=A0A836KDA7_9TRYP|nr:hypothetical protein LSCM1_02827 [Leishmania martiniquensis]
MAKKPLKATHKATLARAETVFGQIGCAPFTFGDAEDARVYAEVEQLLEQLRAQPSATVLLAVQHKLLKLAGFPAVVAVVAGRFPLLFSAFADLERDLGVTQVDQMRVSGVKWDLWWRSTWLSNACAVEDIGDHALTAFASLPRLLHHIEKGDEATISEIWSALHMLSWGLRYSAIGTSLAALVESCEELWLLVELEVMQMGQHVSLQPVLLDLLSALALHVDLSTTLSKRLLTLVAKMTQLSLPAHFDTAVKLFYGCAVAEEADEGDAVGKTYEQLLDAWACMTHPPASTAPALQPLEWIIGAEAKQTIETATELHRLLRSSCNDTALNARAVTAFRKKACEIPAAARAFLMHALPGNPLLWLQRGLANSPTPQVVTAITDALSDVLFGTLLEGERSEVTSCGNALGGSNAYAQLCLQQLWVSGMSVSLSGLLNTRDSFMKAAVVRLLQRLAACTPRVCSTRQVLLGTPSLSLVGDVLAGIANRNSVKADLRKKAVRAVLEHAFDLVCALDHAELASVFNGSIVTSTSTIVSEGKDIPALLHHGLHALAHLAAAFPMAASMALDFDFLAKQFTIADSPPVNIGALIVGSLKVMDAVVSKQPAVVTFEWIEILLGILQNLERWRDAVPGLVATLWQCVRHTAEASEDCVEYLFTEEALGVFRNELKCMQCEDAQHGDIMPSIFAIAVHFQVFKQTSVNEATHKVITRVPPARWTQEMCEGALCYLAESCLSLNCDKAGGTSVRGIVTAAVAVLSGAEQSYLPQPVSACDDLMRRLSESGLASDAGTAFFDLADATAATLSATDGDGISGEAEIRGSTVLLLLQRLFITCPAARSSALAKRAQSLCCALAGTSSSAHTPQLFEAALLLVELTCAGSTQASPTGYSVEMLQLWPSLSCIGQRAAANGDEEAWRAVLSRTYAAAHNLFLASSTIPIVGDCDPRVQFAGQCGLSHVSTTECMAFLQTVFHDNGVRASLQRDYGELYAAALERIADANSHASGAVPLWLQQYLGEIRQS